MITAEQKRASAFSLGYLVHFKQFYVDAYMTRQTDQFGEAWFQVHRLEDDVVLGSADTKEDALSEARYRYPREFDLISC